MAKITKPGITALAPLPVILVSTVSEAGQPNLVTLAWCGVVCSEPPMVGISIRPSRYSWELLQSIPDFVVNLPGEDLARAVDLCGVISGRDRDKFQAARLTPEPASKVRPPLVKECPVNLECQVRSVHELGSHHLFLGEVVAVHYDEAVLSDSGALDPAKAKLYSYCLGEYRRVGDRLGSLGFSKERA